MVETRVTSTQPRQGHRKRLFVSDVCRPGWYHRLDQGQADRLNLGFEYGPPHAMNADTIEVAGYGREQCNDFVAAIVPQSLQGKAAVFAATPGKSDRSLVHSRCVVGMG
jgi:hypothetical protein